MANELAVGATVRVDPFNNAGGLLTKEFKAFQRNRWIGEVVAFRDWSFSAAKWKVRSGDETVWCFASELKVVEPEQS